jgi:hypothetical protein
MFFKRVLDLHDVFAKEEETPGREIPLGSFHGVLSVGMRDGVG